MGDRGGEPAVADFWSSYAEAGVGGLTYVLRNPSACWQGFRAIGDLPIVHVPRPSAKPGGQAITRILNLRGPLGVPARIWGQAALRVPVSSDEHLHGRSAQTLRRKIRAAEKLGLSCRAVDDGERIPLLARANHRERNHDDVHYRVAEPHNNDLLLHDLWLVAEDASGEPLLLSVIPYDGEFAVLRYFRTLGSGDPYSLSRYLATHAVVRALSARGVRWLFDSEPPGAQTNGLRHFQRMVGYRYVRIRLEDVDRHVSH